VTNRQNIAKAKIQSIARVKVSGCSLMRSFYGPRLRLSMFFVILFQVAAVLEKKNCSSQLAKDLSSYPIQTKPHEAKSKNEQ
jgi:hypothetical protein